MVTQDEIIDMLLKSRDLVLIDRQAHVRLADRIQAHGIAPPEGWVLVPVGDLRTVEHRLLNAERVFKRDLTNHKFMGFDLISSSIDIVGAMLAAAPKPEDV